VSNISKADGPSSFVRRLAANLVELGDAWEGAPPPIKFVTWVLVLTASAKVARFGGMSGPLNPATLINLIRAWR
jgi:hypothetical protein